MEEQNKPKQGKEVKYKDKIIHKLIRERKIGRSN